jgi:hypothetical protein
MLRAGIVDCLTWANPLCLMPWCYAKADAANFPFCTIEPNVGVVAVPDERLQVLAKFLAPSNRADSCGVCRYCGLVKVPSGRRVG